MSPMRLPVLCLVALATAACATPPLPVAPPARTTPVSRQATPEPPPKRVALDFEALEADAVDLVDPSTEGEVPAWVYPGNWRVVEEEGGNHVLLHDDMREKPGVSFRVYRGKALGTPDGALPAAYDAAVTMHLRGSKYNYPPTGDQGVQFFYQGPGTYLEVVVKPNLVEIWQADHAEPKSMAGWQRLWHQPMNTVEGDRRRIGARVDRRAGTFTATLDGKDLATVSSTLLAGDRPAWVALRGIGNVVSFDDLAVTPLP